MVRNLISILGLTVVASSAIAQQPILPGSELDHYVRLLEMTGKAGLTPIVYRSLSAFDRSRPLDAVRDDLWTHRRTDALRPWQVGPVTVSPLTLETQLMYTSGYPKGGNDGALWAGRGASGSLSGGAQLRAGPLTGTLYPTVYWAQNRDFELAPVPFADRPEFAYQWSSAIDWPQRFGPDPVAEIDWGQSGLRLDLGGFTAGFSTENLWWGPAVRNPIIMSNTAAGFPHADLGTGRPVGIGVGDLEVRAIWGRLAESRYFDTDRSNDGRYITGITVGYRPSFLPGFTIGGTRVLYQIWPAGGLGLGEIFDSFGEFFNPGRVLPDGTFLQDQTDQLVSLVARWVLPESGFDVYVEWARGDFSGNLRDFLIEPDHSRAFTLGFQKSLAAGSDRYRLTGEATTLGSSGVSQVRFGPTTYYVHGLAPQGYTHRGQLLGAAIGPGGQSQYLGLDRYTPNGRWGGFFERVRADDDAYFTIFSGTNNYVDHQVELTAGASLLRFVGDFDISAGLELSRMLNRYFQRRNDVTNLTAKLSLRWNPR